MKTYSLKKLRKYVLIQARIVFILLQKEFKKNVENVVWIVLRLSAIFQGFTKPSKKSVYRSQLLLGNRLRFVVHQSVKDQALRKNRFKLILHLNRT